MRPNDLRTLTQIGTALWAEPTRARRITSETVTAVALLNLDDERSLERAALTLLERANREGTHATSMAIQQPFYRLNPRERFILTALHSGRWSYARLTHILGEGGIEALSETAWSARLYLASNARKNIPYPSAPVSRGQHCPAYDPKRPWTQSFMDEELTVKERLFLQNHLMACDSCRQTLNRCRDLYFRVESLIPKQETDSVNWDSESDALQRQVDLLLNPGRLSIWDALRVFFRKTDMRIALGVAIALLLLNLVR